METMVLPMMHRGKLRYFPLWRKENEQGWRFYSVYKSVYTSYEYESEARSFNEARKVQNDFSHWEEE